MGAVDSSTGNGPGPIPGGDTSLDRIAPVDDALARLDDLSPSEQVPVYEQLSGLLTAALTDVGPDGPGGSPSRSGI